MSGHSRQAIGLPCPETNAKVYFQMSSRADARDLLVSFRQRAFTSLPGLIRQRLSEIGEEIVAIFDADRKTNQ